MLTRIHAYAFGMEVVVLADDVDSLILLSVVRIRVSISKLWMLSLSNTSTSRMRS